MTYSYAVIDQTGRCFGIHNTVAQIFDPYYVPINNNSINYLSNYYWPICEFVGDFHDFVGEWYLDASHTIKGDETLNGN